MKGLRLLGMAAEISLLVGWVLAGEKGAKQTSDIKDGVLDEIHLKVKQVAGGVPVVIRKFSTEGADLGTGTEGGKEQRVEAVQALRKVAPDLLVERAAAVLKEEGVFKEVLTGDVSTIPENALIVEGRFTMIDPGSRAKRYWGGFGAGKSGVGVEGKITNTAGEVLAEFKHRKHSGVGIGGGDYFKFMSDDTKDVGEDIAKFLGAWATGKDLTKD